MNIDKLQIELDGIEYSLKESLLVIDTNPSCAKAFLKSALKQLDNTIHSIQHTEDHDVIEVISSNNVSISQLIDNQTIAF